MSTSKLFHANKLVIHHGSLVHILGKPFEIFSKYVKIFDLYFVATSSSADAKLLHAAGVLYQYIDNTDDGKPDNEDVYSTLLKNKATMLMFRNQKELNKHSKFFDEIQQCGINIVLDLEANETRPGSIMPHEFDEALEECLHLLTTGYAMHYPEIYGTVSGSLIANAMDVARGGHFVTVPKKYPQDAWYTYYDKTCDYSSQITEYTYWGMTSILGAQRYRRQEIGDEWKLPTREEVKTRDPALYQLLTDATYKLPTKLPQPVDSMALFADDLQQHGQNKTKWWNQVKQLCCCCKSK